MRHFVLAVALAASSSFATAQNGNAPVIDPLWSKAVAQTEAIKKWIASDIAMDIEARDGGEVQKGKTRSHLSGWEKGKPVYKLTAVEPADAKDLPETFDVDTFARMSSGMMTERAPVKRADQQVLDGKKWTVFHLSDTKMGASFNVKVWVDPQSGTLHQTETIMQVPLMANIQITTAYGPHAEMGVVPTGSDIDVESRVPFKSGKMRMLSKPSNWVKRPI
jgi:hypothetical protein